MNLKLSAFQNRKIGTCPHGLPAGACPICSGMGGGGGGARRAQSAGEMSWDECYAVWQQMLRAKNAALDKQEMRAQIQQLPFNMESKLSQFAIKMADFVQKLTNFAQKDSPLLQKMPQIIAKPLVFLAKAAIPVLNVLKNIPVVIQNSLNFIKGHLADISDKLSAIFGEAKNVEDKKASEKTKVKKKLKDLFGIFTVQEAKNEKELPHGNSQ